MDVTLPFGESIYDNHISFLSESNAELLIEVLLNPQRLQICGLDARVFAE